MLNSDYFSFILDVLLVMAGLAAFMARPQIGGELARGLRVLLIGVVALGFAHLIETSLFEFFQVAVGVNEIAHRLFVGFGFILIIAGFIIMRRAFED